jgi:SAM-dependent methyltransferase
VTIDHEEAVDVGGLSVRLLRPSVPEELFAVAAEARGEAPYWAELWPCARTLAAHVATLDLAGLNVLELGCGLALPALVAALRGADVVASDLSADALERVAESGRRTLGHPLATLQADLHHPSALLESGPFDLILGADLLYDRTLAEAIATVIPQLAPAALIAYAWKGSAIPLARPLSKHGYRIAQWRPGGSGPRLLEAVRSTRDQSARRRSRIA